jgi:hypothetical protein
MPMVLVIAGEAMENEAKEKYASGPSAGLAASLPLALSLLYLCYLLHLPCHLNNA